MVGVHSQEESSTGSEVKRVSSMRRLGIVSGRKRMTIRMSVPERDQMEPVNRNGCWMVKFGTWRGGRVGHLESEIEQRPTHFYA